jgi:peptidoglycan/xylan/chitin deacetylase (PgdA/CDA1 family)
MKKALKRTLLVSVLILLTVVPVHAQPLVPIVFRQPAPADKQSTNQMSGKVIFNDPAEPFIISVDDGYSRSALKELISIKQQYGDSFRCLLFPYGMALKDNEDLFIQLVQQGCELNNHTYTHMYFRNKTAAQQEQEIMEADEEIEKVYALAKQQRPSAKYFRPPGGIYDANTVAICDKHGYKLMLWNVITEPNGRDLPLNGRVKLNQQARKGSIILLHSKEKDMDALKIALPVLLKRYGNNWH